MVAAAVSGCRAASDSDAGGGVAPANPASISPPLYRKIAATTSDAATPPTRNRRANPAASRSRSVSVRSAAVSSVDSEAGASRSGAAVATAGATETRLAGSASLESPNSTQRTSRHAIGSRALAADSEAADHSSSGAVGSMIMSGATGSNQRGSSWRGLTGSPGENGVWGTVEFRLSARY
jgi:hypothetical protein